MRLYQVIRWLAANRKRIIFCMQWLYWIKSVYDDTRVSTSFGKRLRKYICIIIVVYSLACNAKKCDFTHIFGPGARAMHDMVCFLYVPCIQVKSHAIVLQLRVYSSTHETIWTARKLDMHHHACIAWCIYVYMPNVRTFCALIEYTLYTTNRVNLTLVESNLKSNHNQETFCVLRQCDVRASSLAIWFIDW